MRKYDLSNKISLSKHKNKSGLSWIYAECGEDEQLKRLGKAGGLLSFSSGVFQGAKKLENLTFLAYRIAQAELLTEQVKATYDLEAAVNEIKYYIENELKDEIKAVKQLKEVLEGV